MISTTLPGLGLARRRRAIGALGIGQILAWGSSYYLPAVLAAPIAADTGWSLGMVVGGLSAAMLVAGLVSVQVGRLIDGYGGRVVLAASSVLLSTGLAALGSSSSLPMFFAAWALIGVGMGAGLYDAAFSSLGAMLGRDARTAISTLTLFGGFASTICWPLSAFLVEAVGWRGACFTYAALHLLITLPLYLTLPGGRGAGAHAGTEAAQVEPRKPGIVLLLAAVLTLAAFIQSAMSVHLLTILQAHGQSLAAAVFLGGLIGPSQVGARVLERVLGARYHPVWTMMAATLLVALGLMLLFGIGSAPALAIMLYGAGVGINSIAKGALPLALFGPHGYPVLMGKLARPSLIAQSAAPVALGMLIGVNVSAANLAIVAAACANLALMACLFLAVRART
ncbi:MFS transporter [Terrihabitans rhizophilus]|uniref:MFS transporter n=1 Tax=Terrihabitans rhizophilus TaxID=3092662 RepID=A0ABU4RMM6_9HYPH|nr:MFS transporter [Terrihabitans sp. PJ23]MDX6804915.1 MFS transporter [Terrihabitans sp. PJ23]